uniref:Polypedatein n=1 Tax=Zhangixalus duboisi TaxID=462329 RepID=I6R7Y9_9NEOB|nr:polypedatein precursor [Zhangixalus duboisi]
MFTLKKSLFLLTFLGVISISLCKRENDDDEDTTEDLEEEEKRTESIEDNEEGNKHTIVMKRTLLCKYFAIC